MTTPNNEIDYGSVTIPTDTPRDEYHYTQRRAEILALIQSKGSPHAINQRSLAADYSVSEGQISQDMSVLADYVDRTIGSKVGLAMHSAFKAAMRECKTARERFDLAMEWADFCLRHGYVEGPALKVEQELTHLDGMETDSYRILAPDDEISVEGEVVDVASIRTGSSESRGETE